MEKVTITVYRVKSQATNGMEVGIKVDGERVTWPPARAVTIAEGIIKAVAEANAGDKLLIDLGEELIEMPAPDAGWMAMSLTMASALAVAETALASVRFPQVAFTQEECQANFKAFREALAHFYKDAFQSFG